MEKNWVIGILIFAVIAISVTVITFYGGNVSGNLVWGGWHSCYSADPCSLGGGDCDMDAGYNFVEDEDGKWGRSSECKTGWCHEDVVGMRDFCDCRRGTVWNGNGCVPE